MAKDHVDITIKLDNGSIGTILFRGRKFTISFLGNLSKNKGVLDAIKAAKIVTDKYAKVRFKFAGSWWRQEPETKKSVFRFI